MKRRGFIKALAGVIGGVALSEAIPFNRVWSFPKEIKIVHRMPAPPKDTYYWADRNGKRLSPNIYKPVGAMLVRNFYDRLMVEEFNQQLILVS